MHRLLQFFVPAATKVSLAININFSGLSFDLLDSSKKNVLQIFIHTIKFYSHVFSILFYINFDSSTEIHTRFYVGEIPFCTLCMVTVTTRYVVAPPTVLLDTLIISCRDFVNVFLNKLQHFILYLLRQPRNDTEIRSPFDTFIQRETPFFVCHLRRCTYKTY